MISIYCHEIVFQEIPDEVSLAFSIAGCSHNCKGCHSPFLHDRKNGELLTVQEIINIINSYKRYVTNVIFFGGEQDIDELIEISLKVEDIKFSWYCGSDNHDEILENFSKYFDYIKIGSYKEELGALNSKNTNQRLYRISDKNIIDITNCFWNKIGD